MGKLIVIEGIDGSGKNTQSRLIKARLQKENHALFITSFPQYSETSSYFVREYLSGNYGKTAESVSPKQASLCYAMDRFHYFKTNPEVKEALADPEVTLIADRYTTSNILFQSAKAESVEEIYSLIDWICDIEYGTLEIPRPDLVLMPYLEFSKNLELLKARNIAENAHKNNMSKDIHELDTEYLRRVHNASQIVADRMGFKMIDCMDAQGELRSVDDIHEEMYGEVMKLVLKR